MTDDRKLKKNPHLWKQPKIWVNWLGRARPLWIFFILLFASCISANWIGYFLGLDRTAQLSLTGTFLEIAGILTVANGLRNKAKLFGAADPIESIISWFQSCPVFLRSKIVNIGAAMSINTTVNADLEAVANLAPNASLNQRVDLLEKNFHGHIKNYRSFKAKMQNVTDELRTDMSKNHDSIQKELEVVRKQSSKAHIGDMAYELVGLFWVMTGMIIANLPEQFARLTQQLLESFAVHTY